MRLSEILTEDNESEDGLAALKQSCDNWMEMYFDANDLKTILTHPYSQQFMTPPAGIQNLYRGLILKGRLLKAAPGKGTKQFVPYATEYHGAEAFLRSLDIPEQRQVIIEKRFNPADFLLDFTGLYESLFPGTVNSMSGYETEYEVWMRATAYYTSADEKEIVSDTNR